MARMLGDKRRLPRKERRKRAWRRAAKRAAKRPANAGTAVQRGLMASLFSAILAMWGALLALAGESCACL